MGVFGVLVTACLLAACGGPGAQTATPSATESVPSARSSEPQGARDTEAYAAALREATNRARVRQGLDPLARSDCAARAASRRAVDLVGEQLVHKPLVEVTEACAPGGRVSENLVDSAADPVAVVEAWMGSPGHRNNIVDPAQEQMGVGCAASGAQMVCSQLFLAAGSS